MASFEELGIGEERAALLRKMGIAKPTPIQTQAIPPILAGRDVIGQAQTGTGKTLAFVLPMLERLDPSAPYVQGLIVSPTRELAIQITAEVKKLTAGTDYRVLAVYGGQDVEAQLHKLQKSMHIIVCTPGRLLDHLRRETIDLSRVKVLVLDEADQMLHMGFLNEVEEILRAVPYRRQSLLFSATMPANVRGLATRFMDKPEEVTVKGTQVTVKDIRQWAVETTDRAKQSALCKLIDEQQPFLAMIFCRTKRRASTLNEALQQAGYNSDELHGDLSQAKREQVMTRFRQAKLQLLVATDVAARGLDVEGVTHVYNYDIPQDVDSYIHRIGRTGRAGASGLAITFVAPRDKPELADIENAIGMAMERVRLDAGDGGATRERAGGEGRGSRSQQGGRGGNRAGGGGGRPQQGGGRGGRPQQDNRGGGRSNRGGESGGRGHGGGPQGGKPQGRGPGGGSGKKSPIRSLRNKSR
ncbi:DEAD/DEAH box helicase [Cohnella candidum]|uniref:DEAD/DEAH box helicase n=1 Tax=Cohnella candidum TaxID=2674991 RepID=A0A3G3K1T3_9BACL|nr:DEAD/DEAH box helicase [Cohnella candidum]AYQ74515.1 DEAD/DEAH box helicase [Cohnella candidum]